MADKLKVKLYSQFHVYYDGSADSVSAVNKTGPFDVLMDHANFFTLLTTGQVLIINGKEKYPFEVEHGVMQVANNEVKVFADI